MPLVANAPRSDRQTHPTGSTDPGLVFLDRNEHPHNEGGEADDGDDETHQPDDDDKDDYHSKSEPDNLGAEFELESGPNASDVNSQGESVDDDTLVETARQE